MGYELVHFENGATSLKSTALGEAMHSSIGPSEEARKVHIGPSRLRERLEVAGGTPLSVFDLGLGIAANALSAVECRLALGPSARPLRIISFENDLNGLKTVLSQPESFPLVATHRAAVETLLSSGRWAHPSGAILWELRAGDFLQDPLDGVPAPEAIYFDFYSPKATPDLWGFHVFNRLRKVCGRERCILTTYSAATRIRSALLLAGFFVGHGEATSAKMETTVAATRREDLDAPLGKEWFSKFNRSARAIPEDLPVEEWESARIRILADFAR
ncbi:MAG: MnmC family methyltransferase [Oligoflexia bacterium]|nr:MnmC family methyltransferase [Oligoflexia bacterium]